MAGNTGVDVAVPAGLTAQEVARRVTAGQVNVAPARTSRSVPQILRANLLTRFNALIGALAALVLVFGHPIDALFGIVVVVNSAIGVVQELRAKRVLDRLAVLARAPVRVRRDGADREVPPEQVVAGDLVLLQPGEKIPVDGEVVVSAALEVDESLLTGEAEPVGKATSDRVLSGSFVVAGSGAFTATRVGPDSYAAGLVAQASTFSLARSELYQGINRFLRYLTWIIVPVGAMLALRQLTADQSLPAAVVGSVAGLVPMIPEGLVLMTSVAFALGVVRLARRRCLVQELPAVEVLARVDVLCLDKTGTLTEPGMVLKSIEPVPGAPTAERIREALAALAAVDDSPNPTIRAVAEAVGDPPAWQVGGIVAFSSARRYSGAEFTGQGAWLLGAPEVMLPPDSPSRCRADELAGHGLRVLALARAAQLASPDRTPVALVVLEHRLRPEAANTLRWFAEQQVSAKVFSGDNPAAVGAVARELGLAGAEHPVDAGGPHEVLAAQVEQHSVFGRVDPPDKRRFVAALRSRGHTVAMTGDGVNDVLALKEADLGIAMGSGSGATRAVAKVVLLDDDFTVLPRVLAEGRRVLANIERVANLFLTKTVYSIILAVLVGLAHLPYPFLPRHITLIAGLTIGLPAFFLALAPSHERARPGFVPRVLRFAIPAGVVCAAASFLAYLLARGEGTPDLRAERSVATITLFLVALFALALVMRPLVGWRLGLLSTMGGVFAAVLAWPAAREVANLTIPDGRDGLVVVAVAGVAGTLLFAALRRAHWLGAQPGTPPAQDTFFNASRTDRPASRE